MTAERSTAHDLALTVAPARDASALVRVCGEVDLATAPALAAALRQGESLAASAVIVDLTAVGFIDCVGLRVLVMAQRRLVAAGRLMTLVVAPGGGVQRILELTDTRDMFSLSGTTGDALALVAMSV